MSIIHVDANGQLQNIKSIKYVLPNGNISNVKSIVQKTKNLHNGGSVHAYSYSKDYLKYNSKNQAILEAGTYMMSWTGTGIPIIQFFNPNTKKQYTIAESEVSYNKNIWYTNWGGKCLAPNNSTGAFRQAKFTVTIPVILTLCVDGITISQLQIEEGEAVTSYQPYLLTLFQS